MAIKFYVQLMSLDHGKHLFFHNLYRERPARLCFFEIVAGRIRYKFQVSRVLLRN